MARKIRIFVSSPGDVRPERERAELVIERVSGRFSHALEFEVIRWEKRTYEASDTFQAQIPKPDECDIVICILWSKLGTPLPKKFMPQGADRVPTGTEFEFEEALRSFEKTGKPDVFVYRKSTEVLFRADRYEDEAQQLAYLKDFWSTWFVNEEGEYLRAYNKFGTTDEFEAAFETNLTRWVEETIGAEKLKVIWDLDVKGSPYRGLEAFDREHADVFFGRSRLVFTAVEKLEAAARRACPFLLLIGSSGSGKSSLARAGIVPRVTLPGVMREVDYWRTATTRPGSGLENLVTDLFDKDCLPELADGDIKNPQELAGHLLRSPDLVGTFVGSALARANAAYAAEGDFEKAVHGQLLIVTDQFESLFLLPQPEQDAMVSVIDTLIRGGHACVIATLRSDAYASYQANPLLTALKADGAEIDVLPPTEADLLEMICGPAEASGLGFEQDSERPLTLEQVLASAASRSGALPLLSFTLSEMFRLRVKETGILTYASYSELGGLEGAIAQRAEQAFHRLNDEEQASLPSILRALVSIEDSPASSALARWVPLESFPSGSPERRLVERFADDENRLLVLDNTSVHVAHEALFTHWPRAAKVIDKDRNFLQVRTRVSRAFSIWKDAPQNEKRARLLTGAALEEGIELLKDANSGITREVVDFVRKSRFRARALRNSLATAVLATAIVFAALWYQSNRLSLSLESTLLAGAADESLRKGHTDIATYVAIGGLTRRSNFSLPGPWSAKAHDALWRASLHPKPKMSLARQSPPIEYMKLGANGRRLLIVYKNLAGEVVDTGTGESLYWAGRIQRAPPEGGVTFEHLRHTSDLSDDGRLAIFNTEDKVVELVDTETGSILSTVPTSKPVKDIYLCPQKDCIVATYVDGSYEILKPQGGSNWHPVYAGQQISDVSFDAVGDKVVTLEKGGEEIIVRATDAPEVVVRKIPLPTPALDLVRPPVDGNILVILANGSLKLVSLHSADEDVELECTSIIDSLNYTFARFANKAEIISLPTFDSFEVCSIADGSRRFMRELGEGTPYVLTTSPQDKLAFVNYGGGFSKVLETSNWKSVTRVLNGASGLMWVESDLRHGRLYWSDVSGRWASWDAEDTGVGQMSSLSQAKWAKGTPEKGREWLKIIADKENGQTVFVSTRGQVYVDPYREESGCCERALSLALEPASVHYDTSRRVLTAVSANGDLVRLSLNDDRIQSVKTDLSIGVEDPVTVTRIDRSGREMLYVRSSGLAGGLDIDSGKTVWEISTGLIGAKFISGPSGVPQVALSDGQSNLILFDKKTGAEISRSGSTLLVFGMEMTLDGQTLITRETLGVVLRSLPTLYDSFAIKLATSFAITMEDDVVISKLGNRIQAHYADGRNSRLLYDDLLGLYPEAVTPDLRFHLGVSGRALVVEGAGEVRAILDLPATGGALLREVCAALPRGRPNIRPFERRWVKLSAIASERLEGNLCP